jgi:MFS family permease
VLLVGRAIQAFGAGGIFPVASAVIAETVPEDRRGRTLGLIGAVFGLAFLLGPLLGGLLLHWSWRWLFLVNVPIAGVLIVAGLRRLPSAAAARPRAFDALGAGTLAVALAGAVWSLSQVDAPNLPASLGSIRIWPTLLVTLVAAVAFWAVEKRAADPVLHPDLFRSRQLRFGVSSSAASLMMLPLVLTLAVGAPIAGQMLDRNGARPVIQSGLMLTIIGLALYAWLPLSLAGFYAAGAAIGFGLSALLGAPLRYVTLEEAGPERRGAGQGLLTLCVSVGQLLGAALVGGIVGSSSTELGGYRHALLTLALACAIALVLSRALRGRVAAGRTAGSV